MNAIRSAAKLFFGFILILIPIELVLRFLPVMYPTELTAGIGVGEAAKHQPGSKFVYSRDWDLLNWRTGSIGPEGFHGHCRLPSDSQASIHITGDSYTEAIMLEPADSLGNQLQLKMPDEAVCAAGMSGAAASEFLSQRDELFRLSKAHTWVIVLSRSDFIESFSGRDGLARFSTMANSSELVGRSYAPPRALDTLFASALFRYVNYNLNAKVTFERFWCVLSLKRCAGSSTQITGEERISPMEEIAVAKFIDGIDRRAKPNGVRVIVLCNDTQKYKGERVEDFKFWSDTMARLQQHGYSAIRVSELLNEASCARAPCFLFRDGHWSANGHRIIAERLFLSLVR